MTPDQKNKALSRILEKITPELTLLLGAKKVLIIMHDGEGTYASCNHNTEIADARRMMEKVLANMYGKASDEKRH